MLEDLRDRAIAVARRVLDLRADLAGGLALPRHLARREVPVRVARHVRRIEVRVLMADGAAHRRRCRSHRRRASPAADAAGRRPSPCVGRSPAGWQFTQRGCRQHLARLGEHRRGACGRAGNARERGGGDARSAPDAAVDVAISSAKSACLTIRSTGSALDRRGSRRAPPRDI